MFKSFGVDDDPRSIIRKVVEGVLSLRDASFHHCIPRSNIPKITPTEMVSKIENRRLLD